MLKMLIIEDNVIQCQQLVNFISSSISDIKLHHMSFCGKEALEIIKSEKVDIIFLDLQLPDMSGMQILKFIENNKLEKYKNSIIIVSSYTYLYSNLSNNPYIFGIVPKPINYEILTRNLKELSIEKNYINNEIFIKSKINSELEYLSYNFSLVGTQYLRECIYFLYISKKYYANLSKDIYPIIAEKFSTTANNVKCNIFQATNMSYYECDEQKMKKYFHNCLYSKPKTKDVITQILKHINCNDEILS